MLIYVGVGCNASALCRGFENGEGYVFFSVTFGVLFGVLFPVHVLTSAMSAFVVEVLFSLAVSWRKVGCSNDDEKGSCMLGDSSAVSIVKQQYHQSN